MNDAVDGLLVYRGIRVRAHDRDGFLALRAGAVLRVDHHPWWSVSSTAARIYATTPAVNESGTLFPVIIAAHLWASFELPTTRLLPDLRKWVKKGSRHTALIRVYSVTAP